MLYPSETLPDINGSVEWLDPDRLGQRGDLVELCHLAGEAFTARYGIDDCEKGNPPGTLSREGSMIFDGVPAYAFLFIEEGY
jgi:hypothetical protein